MKVGDLVTIYYGDKEPLGPPFWVDTTGLVVAIYGHKVDVLIENELECWDISDLLEMKRDKNESR